jgi:hypothetical protein
MEYLGSGKVVVATYTAEYIDLSADNLIAMSTNNGRFSSLLSEVLGKLELWNASDKQKSRKDFALSNTYVKQIGKIEKYLGND